jgi:hypothetical protein
MLVRAIAKNRMHREKVFYQNADEAKTSHQSQRMRKESENNERA